MSDSDDKYDSDEALLKLEAMGEELIDAVRHYDDSTVRELLALGADPNMIVETEGYGPRSILNEAISMNDAGCVVALLEGGANVNEGGARGVSPLKVVVGQNYATLVEPICKAGIERDIIDISLVMACQLGAQESALMLLKCGADPANLTVLGEQSRTAMHFCSGEGDDKVPLVYALLEAGAPLENGLPADTNVLAGCTPLIIACATGALQLVQLYSSFGAKRAPPNAHFTAYTAAGTVDVNRWLQESADWSTPLHHASVVPVDGAAL
jgi:ankyrin repeat protein